MSLVKHSLYSILIRNTDYRIERGIQTYMQQFHIPDKLLFTTCNWDLAAKKSIKSYETSFTRNTFETNTHRIIALIQKQLGQHVNQVEIGMQTCVLEYLPDSFAQELNDVYRHISLMYPNLTLYDYDKDAWNVVDFEKTIESQMFIFHKKHEIHPTGLFPSLAGDKLLGNIFTQYYVPRHDSSASQPEVSMPMNVIPAKFRSVAGLVQLYSSSTSAEQGTGDVYLLHSDGKPFKV